MVTLISILLISGLWAFISPKQAFKFQAKFCKSFGVTMTATPKGYNSIKYLGLASAIVGLLLYFS